MLWCGLKPIVTKEIFGHRCLVALGKKLIEFGVCKVILRNPAQPFKYLVGCLLSQPAIDSTCSTKKRLEASEDNFFL
jgi:hypothetical protein